YLVMTFLLPNGFLGMNMSMIGLPGQFAQSPNFIETLFRHLMDQGPEKLTVILFIHFLGQLYFYLSMDYVKGAIKYLNDKIATHGRAKVEQYFAQLASMQHSLFNVVYSVTTNWMS